MAPEGHPLHDQTPDLPTARRFARLASTMAVACLGLSAAGGRAAGECAQLLTPATASVASPATCREPDLSLWDEGRIAAWRETLDDPHAPPLAVLRIPRIGLEVPIFDGVDEWTLNRAVGRIGGTALPGDLGNLGIAGHRDGYFRGLKDLAPGDELVIETAVGTAVYRVRSTWIVDPTEISVLAPTPTPAVTLVTCYPFYYFGHAPQRFIVRAELEPPLPAAGPV
jgi:LPXTG-site transpeptidase (sortase) family protein